MKKQTETIIPANIPAIVRNNRVILARKRILSGNSYEKIKTGDIFDIFDWEMLREKLWYCLAKDLRGRWYYIHEDLFDWSTPDYEVSTRDPTVRLFAVSGGQD